jgi:elongation factor Ts
MSSISVSLIKDLRAKSGAPMMECKKALMDEEVNGDVDKAMDYLRAKGIAKASNNTRVSAEGLIGVYEKAGVFTMVEVNSETDFVSRNEGFQEFVAKIAMATNELGVQPGGNVDIPTLLAQTAGPSGSTIENLLGDIVASIRENIVIRRAVNLTSNTPSILSAAYVHGKLGGDVSVDGGATSVQLGRESAVVTFSLSKAETDSTVDDGKRVELATAAKRLAMHIVAAKPQYLSSGDVPSSVQESEAAVMREQTLANPPKNMAMLDKIIDAKVNKRLSEISLTGQAHMAVEGAPVISKYMKDLAKDNSLPELELSAFQHWSLGQESSA